MKIIKYLSFNPYSNGMKIVISNLYNLYQQVKEQYKRKRGHGRRASPSATFSSQISLMPEKGGYTAVSLFYPLRSVNSP